MSTAIITGISGQDGSYLAEQLLANGWGVLGTVREQSSALLPNGLADMVELIDWNMHDTQAMAAVLALRRPTAVYNLAARSSGAGMFDSPIEIGEDNGLAVARLLEAIRLGSPETRFCQASSSEMFGRTEASPQNETTAFRPRSPYGAAKLYAHTMVDIYRQYHGLFACSAILYNHESPRRGDGFVTGKIARAAAMVKLGLSSELRLGNIEAQRDWGYAPDYVQAMSLMLDQPKPDDYVVATGEVHTVREFCDVAFQHVGLDYRDFVRDDPATYRQTEDTPLRGNAEKAARLLGWRPRTNFHDLVRLMVEAELETFAAKNNESRQGTAHNAR